jgi:hypothetical protein
MGGAEPDDAVAHEVPPIEAAPPEPEVVAAAGSPIPPAAEEKDEGVSVYGFGIAAGPGGVKVGSFGGRPGPEKARRPNIRVTNWWTGAYDVVDPGTVGAPADPEAVRVDARNYRREVHAMRDQTAQLRHQVRRQAVSARRAAKEQIKQARARAREIQRRAREHRYAAMPQVKRRPVEKAPSAVMAFFALAVLIGGAFLSINVLTHRRSTHEQVLAMSSAALPKAHAGVMGPLSLLLINDHPAATSEAVQKEIERLVELHTSQGWEVVLDDEEAEIAVRGCLPTGSVDPKAPNPLLRNTLVDLDFGGIIRIKSTPGDGPPSARIESVMIAVPDREEATLVRMVVPKPPPAPSR